MSDKLKLTFSELPNYNVSEPETLKSSLLGSSNLTPHIEDFFSWCRYHVFCLLPEGSQSEVNPFKLISRAADPWGASMLLSLTSVSGAFGQRRSGILILHLLVTNYSSSNSHAAPSLETERAG